MGYVPPQPHFNGIGRGTARSSFGIPNGICPGSTLTARHPLSSQHSARHLPMNPSNVITNPAAAMQQTGSVGATGNWTRPVCSLFVCFIYRCRRYICFARGFFFCLNSRTGNFIQDANSVSLEGALQAINWKC